MLIVIVAVLMLAMGGGGAFALVKMGVIGGGAPRQGRQGPPDQKGRKTLRPQERGRQGRRRRRQEVEGEGGSHKTSYYTFSDDFTSNLKQSTALVR
jgi:flagellar FliL protein